MKRRIRRTLTAFLCMLLIFTEEGSILVNAVEPEEEASQNENGIMNEIQDPENEEPEAVINPEDEEEPAGGNDGSVSLNEAWWGIINENEHTVKLTKYTGSENEIHVPDVISGNTVTALGDSIFNGKNITSVELSDSVKTLGSNAFKNCKQLAVIDLKNVETIGGRCFEGDVLIREVVLPETLKSVGGNIFDGCTGIKKVTLNSVQLDDLKNAFYGCTSLEDMDFSESCNMIPKSMFFYTSISSCVIPPNIKTIGDYAFKRCERLDTIDLGNVETIGSHCFEEDPLIREVILPETLQSVGSNIFNKCTGIKKVTLKSVQLQD
nr:leucine-rich repeat domain-containing protein [Lachnospiraceae bacterium]